MNIAEEILFNSLMLLGVATLVLGVLCLAIQAPGLIAAIKYVAASAAVLWTVNIVIFLANDD